MSDTLTDHKPKSASAATCDRKYFVCHMARANPVYAARWPHNSNLRSGSKVSLALAKTLSNTFLNKCWKTLAVLTKAARTPS
eukprot:6478311-Amphidinium_carterae.1